MKHIMLHLVDLFTFDAKNTSILNMIYFMFLFQDAKAGEENTQSQDASRGFDDIPLDTFRTEDIYIEGKKHEKLLVS